MSDLLPFDEANSVGGSLIQQITGLDPRMQDAVYEILGQQRQDRINTLLMERAEAAQKAVQRIESEIAGVREQINGIGEIKTIHEVKIEGWLDRTQLGMCLPGEPSRYRLTMLFQVIGILTKSKYRPYGTKSRHNEPIRPKKEPVVQNHVAVRQFGNKEFGEPVFVFDPDWVVDRINGWMAKHELTYQYGLASESTSRMNNFIDRLWEKYGKREVVA